MTESYPTSASNANGSHSNFALWYARTIEPRVQIDSETVDLKNNRVGSGRQNDPTKDDTSAPDMVEGNTNTPLKDVYDYGGDNLKPDTLRFRVWATNKTTKELDTLEIPGLDIKGAYYDQLNYSDVLPEGIRTQKIWIPVQFIRKTISSKQTNGSFSDADLQNVLKENRFVVSKFKLYLANTANQKLAQDEDYTDTKKTTEYDLYTELLKPLIDADGQIGSGSKYLFYANKDGEKVTNYDDAFFYGIDTEAMFADKELTPVKYKDPKSDGYFLQDNILAMDYQLTVRTNWKIDYHQNLLRYFGPNTAGNEDHATLTGKWNEALKAYTTDPAELEFEGIFAEKYYNEKNETGGWDTYSRPTVSTDPLVLSKIVTNKVQMQMRTASINSVDTSSKDALYPNTSTNEDNYKKVRFTNRASKINLSLNRLPYDNTLAGGLANLQPRVENGDVMNNRPLGLNYGGNDFNKANPDYDKNKPQTSVDVTHLIPGDRVNYYITAINDKDDTATESGEMRESVNWVNPVLRFEAPEGMRIARWVYMPEDYPIGMEKNADDEYEVQAVYRVDEDGHYLNDADEPILDADGNFITDPTGYSVATQPLAADNPNCGVKDYQAITVDQIEAYDPNYKDVNSKIC